MSELQQILQQLSASWAEQQQRILMEMKQMHDAQMERMFNDQREQREQQQRMLEWITEKEHRVQVEPEIREGRAEGLAMPTYSGKEGESVHNFMFQARNFFQAKNLNVNDPRLQPRLISLLVGNLRGAAAAWYPHYISYGNVINNMDDFEQALMKEFVPEDHQAILRKRLRALAKQSQKMPFRQYLYHFRQILMQVTDMSEVDKKTYFIEGLKENTRKNITFERCATLADAISAATSYEDAFYPTYEDNMRNKQHGIMDRNTRRIQRSNDRMEICNVNVSREEIFAKKLCFNCKRPGHRSSQCPQQRYMKSKSYPINNSRMRYNNNSKKYVNTSQYYVNPRIHDESVEKSNYNYEDRQNTAVNYVKFDPYEQDETYEMPNPRYNEFSNNHFAFSSNVNTSNMLPIYTAEEQTLLIKKGNVNNKEVNILIDSGGSSNLIRPGLSSNICHNMKVTAKAFDNSESTKTVNVVKETVFMEGRTFKDISFMEWPLPSTHDVLLGQPWCVKYNPNINWRSGLISYENEVEELQEVDEEEFKAKLEKDEYLEVFSVKVSTTKEETKMKILKYC